jgi:serine/threonine protein kinase
MDVLGAPTEDDLSFVTDQTAINYLKEFQPNSQGIEFKERFPFASREALDLVQKMVQFNPFFRISIGDCLAHPFLAKVRKPHLEIVGHT